MVWAIFTKELRLIFQDKSMYFWMLALPIAFIVIFSAIFGNMEMDQGTASSQIVPGYTVMFVFFIMISMVQHFLRDRDSGMLARLNSTMMKPIHFMLGMWLPHICVLLIQSAVLLGFGHLVYGLELGNIASVLVIVFALAVCATGLGLMLAMLTNSLNAAIAIVQITAFGGAVLGGLWFPFNSMPEGMQMIGQFLPQRWALQALQAAMLDDAGFQVSEVWRASLLLLGLGAFAAIAAILLYKSFSEKSFKM